MVERQKNGEKQGKWSKSRTNWRENSPKIGGKPEKMVERQNKLMEKVVKKWNSGTKNGGKQEKYSKIMTNWMEKQYKIVENKEKWQKGRTNW